MFKFKFSWCVLLCKNDVLNFNMVSLWGVRERATYGAVLTMARACHRSSIKYTGNGRVKPVDRQHLAVHPTLFVVCHILPISIKFSSTFLFYLSSVTYIFFIFVLVHLSSLNFVGIRYVFMFSVWRKSCCGQKNPTHWRATAN